MSAVLKHSYDVFEVDLYTNPAILLQKSYKAKLGEKK